MSWSDNYNKNAADDFEHLAYSPSGGKMKLILLGLILPLVIVYFGVQSWTTEQAIWPGHRDSNIKVRGAAAKSVGVMQMSVALFCHARWFCGLLPNFYQVFRIGTTLALLGFLGGLCFGLYYLFS